MPKCVQCGKWAGFFKRIHVDCEAKAAEERAKAAEESARAEEFDLQRRSAVARAAAYMQEAARSLDGIDENLAHISALEEGDRGVAAEAFLVWLGTVEGLPDSSAEAAANAIVRKFGIEPDGDEWGRFVRRCAYRDLLEGKFPERISVSGGLPFLLERGEVTVWVFPKTCFLQDRVITSSARNYAGLSLRVAPGVYAHGGQRLPASTSEGLSPVDFGLLALTDRAILFSGAHKALRFKYKDIAAMGRIDFGFTVCKGTQTARNLGFLCPDPLVEFPYMMLKGLAELHRLGKPS
jgi:hypothetical protein